MKRLLINNSANSVMLRLLYIGVNTVTQLKCVVLNKSVNTVNTVKINN